MACQHRDTRGVLRPRLAVSGILSALPGGGDALSQAGQLSLAQGGQLCACASAESPDAFSSLVDGSAGRCPADCR